MSQTAEGNKKVIPRYMFFVYAIFGVLTFEILQFSWNRLSKNSESSTAPTKSDTIPQESPAMTTMTSLTPQPAPPPPPQSNTQLGLAAASHPIEVAGPIPGWASNNRMSKAEQAPAFNNVGELNTGLCNRFQTFGSGDEAKEICMDAMPVDNSCVVFSIGSNNEWGFERAVFRQTNCQVHTFDCTGNWQVPSDIASRVTLYHKCIGAAGAGAIDGYGGAAAGRHGNANDNMVWTDLVALAGGNVPHYLKMDIEGWEWLVLEQVLDSNLRPFQIGFELHLYTHIPVMSAAWVHVKGEPANAKYVVPNRNQKIRELFDIMRQKGYELTQRHDNPFCAHCSELVIQKLK